MSPRSYHQELGDRFASQQNRAEATCPLYHTSQLISFIHRTNGGHHFSLTRRESHLMKTPLALANTQVSSTFHYEKPTLTSQSRDAKTPTQHCPFLTSRSIQLHVRKYEWTLVAEEELHRHPSHAHVVHLCSRSEVK